MTIQYINTGAVPNDGTGDKLRDAFTKINENFAELEAVSIVPNDVDATPDTLLLRDASGNGFVNKLYFKNTFANTGAFPSAVTYPGMFVMADNTGLAYYSDGATWSVLGGAGSITGMDITLAAPASNPSDGSFSGGAVTLNDAVKVTDAIDSLNEMLGLLIPAQPPELGTFTTLGITNVGSLPLLADGAIPLNADSGQFPSFVSQAGYAVNVPYTSGRITSTAASTNVVTEYGSGTAGILAVEFNGDDAGHILADFTTSGSPTASTVGFCVMTGRASYPVATPGFWRSFNVQAVMTGLSTGWNKVRITHSQSGNTNSFYFLRDSLSTVPVVAGTILLTENGSPTVTYSSNVPHYGDTTATLDVAGVTMTNLAGETYYGGDPFVFSGTNSIIAAQYKTYANVGITTPIARQTVTATALTTQTVSVNGTNIHDSGLIRGMATNVNGNSSITNMTSTVVLVKRGTAAATRIDENAIPVTGLGSVPNADYALRRGGFANSDTPVLSGDAAWTSSAAVQVYDAVVAGGTLSHNQTNYTTGYLPAGPDLSVGRSGTQYFTCKFRRESRSNFKINVTGTYAGCWVALPGVSSVSSTTQWWDMFSAFLGSGYPGDTTGGNGSNGCASGTVMAGTSGTFTCTFGTESSSNSTNNDIIIRFKLTSGQSITALSFSN